MASTKFIQLVLGFMIVLGITSFRNRKNMTEKQREESSLIGSILIIFPSLILIFQANYFQQLFSKVSKITQLTKQKIDEQPIITQGKKIYKLGSNLKQQALSSSFSQNQTSNSRSKTQISDIQGCLVVPPLQSNIHEINEDLKQECDHTPSLKKEEQQKIKSKSKRRHKKTNKSEIFPTKIEFQVQFEDRRVNQTEEKIHHSTPDISSILQDESFLFENQQNASVQESIFETLNKMQDVKRNPDQESKNNFFQNPLKFSIKPDYTMTSIPKNFKKGYSLKENKSRSTYDKSSKRIQQYQSSRRTDSNTFYTESKYQPILYKEKTEKQNQLKIEDQSSEIVSDLVAQKSQNLAIIIESGSIVEEQVIDINSMEKQVEIPEGQPEVKYRESEEINQSKHDLISDKVAVFDEDDNIIVQLKDYISPKNEKENSSSPKNEEIQSIDEEKQEDLNRNTDENTLKEIKIPEEDVRLSYFKKQLQGVILVQEMIVENDQNDNTSLNEQISFDEERGEQKEQQENECRNSEICKKSEIEYGCNGQKQIVQDFQLVDNSSLILNENLENNFWEVDQNIQNLREQLIQKTNDLGNFQEINEKTDTIVDDLFFLMVSIFDLF